MPNSVTEARAMIPYVLALSVSDSGLHLFPARDHIGNVAV
jgi:hypothetical protein